MSTKIYQKLRQTLSINQSIKSGSSASVSERKIINKTRNSTIKINFIKKHRSRLLAPDKHQLHTHDIYNYFFKVNCK